MLGSGRWPPLAVPSAPEQPLGWSGGKYFYFLRTGFPAPREGTHARMLRNIPLRLLPRRGAAGGSSGSVALASQLALAEEQQAGGDLPPAPGAAPAGIVDASIVDAFDDWHRGRARSILHKIRFHAGDFCGLWRSPEQRVRESVRRLHYDPYERRTAAAAAQPTGEAAAGGVEASARTERRRLKADELGALCRRLATDDRRSRAAAAAEQLATAAARPKATIDAAALRALVERLSKESPPSGIASSNGGALQQPQQQRLSAEEIEHLVARLSFYDETKWPPESWRNRKLKQRKTKKIRRTTAPQPAASDAGLGLALPITFSEADDAAAAATEDSSFRSADMTARVGETVLSRTGAEES